MIVRWTACFLWIQIVIKRCWTGGDPFHDAAG
jgi:hypothetical protein